MKVKTRRGLGWLARFLGWTEKSDARWFATRALWWAAWAAIGVLAGHLVGTAYVDVQQDRWGKAQVMKVAERSTYSVSVPGVEGRFAYHNYVLELVGAGPVERRTVALEDDMKVGQRVRVWIDARGHVWVEPGDDVPWSKAWGVFVFVGLIVGLLVAAVAGWLFRGVDQR